MLRLWLAKLRTAECDAMIGAFDRATVCIIDAFDGCETSTIMPRRFISAITSRPRGLTPLFGASFVFSPVFESDSWLCPLCASDRQRPPRRRIRARA